MSGNIGNSILVVDDEQYLRTTLGMVLQRAGYHVVQAASAAEALQILAERRFNLAFLDLRMPGMDGVEALPLMLVKQSDLPVLILTANASVDMAIKLLGLGASGYILKPIDPDQIIIRVQEVLLERQHSLRRQEILREIQGIVSELKQI